MERGKAVNWVAIAIALIVAFSSVYLSFTILESISDISRKTEELSEIQQLIAELTGVKEDIGFEMRELISKAKAEGKLVWYSSNPPKLLVPILQAFKEKYGIDYSYYRAIGYTLLEKIRSEQAAGVYEADVLQLGASAQQIAIMEGLTVDYKPMITETGAISEEFYDPEGKYIVPLIMDIPIIVMRGPDRIPEDKWPTAWSDFANPLPEWQGKLTQPSPVASSSAYTMLWCWDHYLGRETAKAIVQGFVRAGGRYHTVWAAQYDDLIAGTADIDLDGLSHEWKINLIDKGIDAVQVFPEDGTIVYTMQTSIVKNAPHPNAAKLFLEFLLSKACQSLLAEKFAVWPVRGDVTLSPGKRSYDEVKTIMLDPVKAAEDREELITLFEQWVAEAQG